MKWIAFIKKRTGNLKVNKELSRPGSARILSNLSNWARWVWGLRLDMQHNLVLKHKQDSEMSWYIRTILFRELKGIIGSSTRRLRRCWKSIAHRPKKQVSNFGLIWNKVGISKRKASHNNASRRFNRTARGRGKSSKFQQRSVNTSSRGRSSPHLTRCSWARAKENYHSNTNTSLVTPWTQWALPYMKQPDSVQSPKQQTKRT
mgnify:CR=1 FL=1